MNLVQTFDSRYGKAVIALPKKLLSSILHLSLYMSNVLALKDLSWDLLQVSTNPSVFDSKIVLMICYRLFLRYFGTCKVVRVGFEFETLAKGV